MEVLRPADASTFLELAGPLLERDEARNQLPLGIAATMVEKPDAYEICRFWVVVDGQEPVAAALRTPPYNLVLADPISPGVVSPVLEAVASEDPDVPGVVGNMPYVAEAAERLAAAVGRRAEQILAQGVYALRAIHQIARSPGEHRVAGAGDRDLLRRWITAFLLEAVPEPDRHIDQLEQTLDIRLEEGSGGFWFWDLAGAPVSLSGYGGRTPTGIRIGPVYTPPEHRRRGYATTLVADQSRWLLEQGHRTCFLYTDLANPTSNRIYTDIGYERVCNSLVFVFAPPETQAGVSSANQATRRNRP